MASTGSAFTSSHISRCLNPQTPADYRLCAQLNREVSGASQTYYPVFFGGYSSSRPSSGSSPSFSDCVLRSGHMKSR